MPTKEIRNELHALRSELASNPASALLGSQDSETTSPEQDMSECERVLRELQTAFTEIAGEAEDLVTEHPVVSIAASFILGVIVGRISGGLK